MITDRVLSGHVEPAPVLPDPPTAPAALLDMVEKRHLTNAAIRVARLYPGPVGELVAAELTAWREFGYRLGTGGPRGDLLHRLLEHIFATPLIPPLCPDCPH